MTNSFTNLGLTDVSAPAASSSGGCCGGGGCMCGASDSTSAASSASATSGTATSGTATSGTATQDFLVTGMTCAHCVSSVTEELSELDGVDAVAVELNVGAASKVRVSASAPLDVNKVRAAVADAGYEMVGTSA